MGYVMQFSVIYSVDYPRFTYLGRKIRPKPNKAWTVTEDGTSEYDGWEESGQHYKYCAILTKKEFIEFVRDAELYADPIETMGSLGAPGFGFGWAPAISFHNHDYPEGIIGNAYVTPLPEPVGCDEKSFSERDFQRIKKVMVKVFR